MNRYFINYSLIMISCILCLINAHVLLADDTINNIQIITQEQAAEFASKLANERCNKSFGKAPFAPNSYVAKLVDSRWYWGKIESPGIHGYSAEIEFNIDSSEQKVRVVLHTDQIYIEDKTLWLDHNIKRQGEEQGIDINDPEEMKNLEKMGIEINNGSDLYHPENNKSE